MQGKHPEAIAVVLLDKRTYPYHEAREAGWYWIYGTPHTNDSGYETIEYEQECHGPYDSAAEAMMHALSATDSTTSS